MIVTKAVCDLCGEVIPSGKHYKVTLAQVLDDWEQYDDLCFSCLKKIEDFISKLRRDDNETA